MKKIIFLLAIAFATTINSNAQFKQQMGPAMNMDNSIGTILMDLSTQNKEYHMKGEKSTTDTFNRFYPNRLFGANIVYIKANYDKNSYETDSYDETTKGQIIASFTPTGTDLMEPLKALKTNLESSTVWQKFFEKDTKNNNLNIIMYVQKAAFELPPNKQFTETQLTELNRGLKLNFEKYEIRMGIETKTVEAQGYSVEFIQIRSWVQIKESIAAKEKADRKKNYENEQKRIMEFEKTEMGKISNGEAKIIKPNKPGINFKDDNNALQYFRARQDSLADNFQSIMKSYKAFSTTEKLANKQKYLKMAKETLLAYETNNKQFENYIQNANFNDPELKDKARPIGAEASKNWWGMRLIDHNLSMIYAFTNIIETFDLKY
jgi:hypothetical protein